MPSFAIIAEGATDQAVLENILQGFFQELDEELVVNLVQPPPLPKGGVPAPGGWTLVFRALREGKHREALQYNDYVVLHIDTDVSEEMGYDVSHRAEDGSPHTPEVLIRRVADKLNSVMAPPLEERNASRIVFAIAVDAIECWILPLLYEGEPKKKAKITGCLGAADWKLKRDKQTPLSAASGKNVASYQRASRGYASRRTLMKHRSENPSLHVFVTNLEERGSPDE